MKAVLLDLEPWQHILKPHKTFCKFERRSNFRSLILLPKIFKPLANWPSISIPFRLSWLLVIRHFTSGASLIHQYTYSASTRAARSQASLAKQLLWNVTGTVGLKMKGRCNITWLPVCSAPLARELKQTWWTAGESEMSSVTNTISNFSHRNNKAKYKWLKNTTLKVHCMKEKCVTHIQSVGGVLLPPKLLLPYFKMVHRWTFHLSSIHPNRFWNKYPHVIKTETDKKNLRSLWKCTKKRYMFSSSTEKVSFKNPQTNMGKTNFLIVWNAFILKKHSASTKLSY